MLGAGGQQRGTGDVQSSTGTTPAATEQQVDVDTPDEGAPSRRRISAWQACGVIMTGIGVLLLLFFVYLYGFTTLVGNRNQHHLAASLTGNVKALYGLVNGKPATEGQPVALVEIPALGLKQVVVYGTTASDLTNGPGTPAGDGAARGGGHIGHRRKARHLRRCLRRSAQAAVGPDHQDRGRSGDFRYVVRSTQVVTENQLVVGPTRANQLLLVTSNSTVLPGSKLIVTARLVGSPSPLTPSTHGVRAMPLVLSGDTTAGVLAIVWTLLFLVVAVTTVWSTRRWGRAAVAYRLAIPVLLACGLLACESLAQWLPATL